MDATAQLPFQGLLYVAVETPQGDLIEAVMVAGFPTVERVMSPHMIDYRMTLPVDDGAGEHARTGPGQALLKVNRKTFKHDLSTLEKLPQQHQDAVAHGAKYTALIHACSNLRMRCNLQQNSFEPGARLVLCTLRSEYGPPLPKSASVRPRLSYPTARPP